MAGTVRTGQATFRCEILLTSTSGSFGEKGQMQRRLRSIAHVFMTHHIIMAGRASATADARVFQGISLG